MVVEDNGVKVSNSHKMLGIASRSGVTGTHTPFGNIRWLSYLIPNLSFSPSPLSLTTNGHVLKAHSSPCRSLSSHHKAPLY
jgi:hypothetical protein